MNEMFGCPLLVVLMALPLLVYIEQGQVVALWHLEVFSRSITFSLPVLRPKEYGRDAQHAHYGQNFLRALETFTDNQ